MFRCNICGQTAPVGTRAHKVVLESRPKNYASRGGQEGFQRRFRGRQAPRPEFDKGGQGHEIVREVLACERCAKQATPVTVPATLDTEAAPATEAEAAPPISDSPAIESPADDSPVADIQPTESQ